ncbi:hypothetical protein MMC08_008262 [Hypocenomyce scalaris]|nr:hypothetical protein [Hypocenomyce scalaris]
MSSSSSSSSSALLASLHHDGYVLVPALLTAEELSVLRAACLEVTALAREGKWPYIRTLPKQFPPWSETAEAGIWGVQHLMHPSLPAHEVFTASYFSDAIIGIVKELLDCEVSELVMELYNLLVRPERDFELRWHRDDIPWEASPEEELQRLGEPAWHAQWNLALYDDESLIVVPGSHSRPRTEHERHADAYEKDLPGEKSVKMKAGDVVFYNNNMLHRGVYDSKVERMTLHGSMGHVKGSRVRARNVLQHGVGEWVDRCDFGPHAEPEKSYAEGMRQRLVQIGRDRGDLGYSLHE